MIFMMVHDMRVSTNELDDQELVVEYGSKVQRYPLIKS